MTDRQLRRRDWLGNCITKGLLVAGATMPQGRLLAFWQQGQRQASQPTPSEVLGPFYMKNAPNVAAMRKSGDSGFPLRVAGRVVNTRGEKVPEARVDLWHADHARIYDVQGYRFPPQTPAAGVGRVRGGDRHARSLPGPACATYPLPDLGSWAQDFDHAGLLRDRSLLGPAVRSAPGPRDRPA